MEFPTKIGKTKIYGNIFRQGVALRSTCTTCRPGWLADLKSLNALCWNQTWQVKPSMEFQLQWGHRLYMGNHLTMPCQHQRVHHWEKGQPQPSLSWCGKRSFFFGQDERPLWTKMDGSKSIPTILRLHFPLLEGIELTGLTLEMSSAMQIFAVHSVFGTCLCSSWVSKRNLKSKTGVTGGFIQCLILSSTTARSHLVLAVATCLLQRTKNQYLWTPCTCCCTSGSLSKRWVKFATEGSKIAGLTLEMSSAMQIFAVHSVFGTCLCSSWVSKRNLKSKTGVTGGFIPCLILS